MERRIGPVDTIWLNMDRPNNLMVIEVLVLLDGPVRRARLMELARDRLLAPFPVFRQRPIPPRTPFGLPRWRDDPDFDLSRHIHVARLRPPGDDAALRRYVEKHMSRPLDRAHPLWEWHLINGYRGGAALFCRVHHSVADGMALVRLLLSLSDEPPPTGLPAVATRAARGAQAALPFDTGVAGEVAAAADATVSTVVGGVAGAARRATNGALAAVTSVAGAGADLVRRVSGPTGARLLGDLAVLAAKGVAVADKLVLGHNPPSLLDHPPRPDKLAVWSEPVPLAAVKKAGRMTGATVNDVLMSALAGAISTYLTEHGGPVADLSTMMPVNMRPLDRLIAGSLGNRFALVFVPLPVDVRAPLARLAETKRRMDAIKRSPEAAMTFAVIAAIGRTWPAVERRLVDFFAGKAVGVTTNVIGPRSSRYLAGVRISGVLAWVPCSGRQTLGVCIVTYDDTVRVGFKVDAATVADPERLVEAFHSQLRPLLRLAGVRERTRSRTGSATASRTAPDRASRGAARGGAPRGAGARTVSPAAR